jgi:U3 small nucleolar RNA-associated protein 4
MPNKTVDTMAWVCGACEQQAPISTISFYSDFHKTHSEIHSRRTLLGASKDGTLFVVDFAKGGFSAITGSGGGGVFSLTSLCGSDCCKSGTCPGLVAVGCEDGNVRIFKLKQDNLDHRLDLVSTIPVAGGSILSLAWRRYSDSPGNGMSGTVMYIGVADGTIRRYECKSAVDKARSKGNIVNFEAEYGKQTWFSNSRMTVESYGRTTPTRIWALKTLADGTVVSGDSLGHVQFWDGNTGTLLCSFEQNDQKADILALAVTPDECQVFASGIDSRVICIERPTVHDSQNGPPRWIMTHAQRPHTHDVKALVVCRVHDSKGSMVRADKPYLTLCSGGVDTKICTVLVDKFKNGRPRVWFPWPSHSPISIAKAGRILLLRRQKSIDLHQLGPQQTDSLPLILDEDKRFVGTLDITSSHNLVCSDISSDGSTYLASTGSNLLLFDIKYIENVDGSLGFTAKQLKLQGVSKLPCSAAKFVSADAIVCAYSNGDLRLLKLSRSINDATSDVHKPVTVRVVDSFVATREESNKLFAVHSLSNT